MMSDETKKGQCEKCGTWFWLDRHHIWPKAAFGGKGLIAKLCPNCHRDFHEKLGRNHLKNTDSEFHEAFFKKWLTGALVLTVGALAYWLLNG